LPFNVSDVKDIPEINSNKQNFGIENKNCDFELSRRDNSKIDIEKKSINTFRTSDSTANEIHDRFSYSSEAQTLSKSI